MSDSTPSHPTPEPETPQTTETPTADMTSATPNPDAGSSASTEPSNPSAPDPTTPAPPSPDPTEAPAPPATPPLPPAAQEPAVQEPASHAPASHAPAAHAPAAQAAAPAPVSEKRNGNIGVIAALAIGALIGGVSGAGISAIAITNAESPSSTQGPSTPNITVNDPGNATTVTAVASSAAPSVVTISVRGEGASGTGSGVFLTKDGYVLTNAHVATLSGATSDPAVKVQTSDGRLYDATLVGSDPVADLAVVKVDADDVSFEPATFADSSKLNVGDTVVALGAPLGLSNTVTSGIVSALGRSITVASSAVPETEDAPAPDDQGDNPNGPFDFWDFDNRDVPNQQKPTATIALPVIQTDAAINPGNSGGALLDSDGKVIGINVAIATAGGSQEASGNIGVGFAIPANFAKRIASELIDNGKASHGLLGANVLSVADDADAADSDTVGSVIKKLTPGGAADEAGLKVGDIVTQFNGMPITSSTDLTAQVRVLAGGSDAELVYVRNGKTETVTVTLGEL